MSAVGMWTVGLALAYTGWLILGGRWSLRHASDGREGFFVGGRSFGPWTVAFCITALFSGSSYIAIVELSYRTGVSAAWYGVAETVQVLLIALLLVKPLRRRLVITVTGVIGDRFGRTAKGIASVITGFTFPMYSVATTIAFASALSAVTGLALPVSVACTAVVLLVFLSSGGMRSVAFSQTMNVMMIALMFFVGVWALFASDAAGGLRTLHAAQPQMFDPGNAGVALIVAWFGTFIVNVPLAQAAFQMSMSARSPEDGQKGLFIAAGLGLPLIALGVTIGLVAHAERPDATLPLLAIPEYIASAVPPWAAGLFFVGLWACALGWAGPCQFSGATSLGRDLGSAVRPRSTEKELVRYTKTALVVLTVVMVVFAILRTEQAAWWNVLAWTLRNGATFAPVLAVFFWPLATRAAGVTALLAGFASGLTWYALTGFRPAEFYQGVHPVWVGMTANLAALTLVTLLQAQWQRSGNASRRRRGSAALMVSALLIVLLGGAIGTAWFRPFAGLTVFVIVFALFMAAASLTERKESVTRDPTPTEAPTRDERSSTHALGLSEV